MGTPGYHSRSMCSLEWRTVKILAAVKTYQAIEVGGERGIGVVVQSSLSNWFQQNNPTLYSRAGNRDPID